MPISTDDLRYQIQVQIDNLTGTESSDEVLSLAAALNNVTSNRIIRVQNYSELPNLTTTPLPSGSLVFVKQLNIMMMSIGNQWRGMDGRVYSPAYNAWAWGYNSVGPLGDNTTSNRSSPVTVVGGITNWKQIACGGNGVGSGHTLGITATGMLYAWGSNGSGRLGDNTTSDRSSPVTVVGGITNWNQVAAGVDNSLGITLSAILYAWGNNSLGGLGDGTTTARSSPVTVVGGITNWKQITAGNKNGFGLTSTNVLYSWGWNDSGRLGDNTTATRLSPVTVVGGITTWNKILSKNSHSLGLTTTGIIYAWGSNSTYGQLGDNTTSDRSSPVTVVGGITNWSQISAGGFSSFAIRLPGTLYAWGGNLFGNLGTNNASLVSSPVTVVGGITNWIQVSAGYRSTFGITGSGIAYAWGRNDGALGDNTTTARSSPVTVVAGSLYWASLTAGGRHSVAIAIQ